jgi:N6-L-threonylcarbamoyladenine synthase
MLVLGIETSCDDTSLALYAPDRGVIANVTAAQLEHDDFGGVVPEIASRQHIKAMLPVFDRLMKQSGVDRTDIDGVGVSNGPGLVGSLLVGVGFAKSLAWGLGRPVVGVHHIEAHVLSNELDGVPLEFPCVTLVVSGGHTQLFYIPAEGDYRLVGATRDDAAGEAFDKIAKLLGLGFPGGPAVQRAAERGDPGAVDFPRAMRGRGNYDFSFSGLKTAVRLHVEAAGALDEMAIADVAASAQRAIVEVLIEKTLGCADDHGVAHVYLAGGVAANAELREGLAAACSERGMDYHAPLLRYCTDNGAMVALAAHRHLDGGRDDGVGLDVFARGTLGPGGLPAGV